MLPSSIFIQLSDSAFKFLIQAHIAVLWTTNLVASSENQLSILLNSMVTVLLTAQVIHTVTYSPVIRGISINNTTRLVNISESQHQQHQQQWFFTFIECKIKIYTHKTLSSFYSCYFVQEETITPLLYHAFTQWVSHTDKKFDKMFKLLLVFYVAYNNTFVLELMYVGVVPCNADKLRCNMVTQCLMI